MGGSDEGSTLQNNNAGPLRAQLGPMLGREFGAMVGPVCTFHAGPLQAARIGPAADR